MKINGLTANVDFQFAEVCSIIDNIGGVWKVHDEVSVRCHVGGTLQVR